LCYNEIYKIFFDEVVIISYNAVKTIFFSDFFYIFYIFYYGINNICAKFFNEFYAHPLDNLPNL